MKFIFYFVQIYVHAAGLQSLHKYIPKDILPEEYGGFAGPLESIHGELAVLTPSLHLFNITIEGVFLSSDFSQNNLMCTSLISLKTVRIIIL